MSVGTIFLKQLQVVLTLALSFPIIGMDVLTQGLTWRIKPKLLAFVMGAAKRGLI